MTIPDMNKDVLNELPQKVLERMDEVGLRGTLEVLFQRLNSGNVSERVADDIVELLDWTLVVLATASQPLLPNTFCNINNGFAAINQSLIDHMLPAKDDMLSILRELSYIPGQRSVPSQVIANRLNDGIKKARRNLIASETRFKTKQEEVENTFTEFLEDQRRSLIGKVNEIESKLGEVESSTTSQHDSILEQMNRLLEDLRERYGFTAEQVLGGAHESAANAERELAQLHSLRSRWSMWGAVVWAGILQVVWLFGFTPEWDQWFDAARALPIVGSPVVILLFVAKREGSVASEHRVRFARLQSLALQFKSWKPYVETLTEEARSDFEKDITPKLFVGDTGILSPPDT
ncbi:MAG: hypothetical protein F4119_05515 [Acidimicrobiia bacterium]|nr:hypothetical protein [Acidimicrobiia bacterium]